MTIGSCFPSAAMCQIKCNGEIYSLWGAMQRKFAKFSHVYILYRKKVDLMWHTRFKGKVKIKVDEASISWIVLVCYAVWMQLVCVQYLLDLEPLCIKCFKLWNENKNITANLTLFIVVVVSCCLSLTFHFFYHFYSLHTNCRMCLAMCVCALLVV